jgi:CoA-binding domain
LKPIYRAGGHPVHGFLPHRRRRRTRPSELLVVIRPTQGLDNHDAEGRSTGVLARDRLQAVRAGDDASAAPTPSGTTAPVPGVGGALRRYRTIATGLALTDAACILVALMASYQVRYSMRPMPLAELAVVVAAPLLWVGVFRAFDLYAPQHLAPPEQFRRVIGATSLGIVLVVMASYWSKSSFPRSWIGLGWLLALLFEFGTRGAWDRYQGRLKRTGRLAFRTLIVGTTAEATRLGLHATRLCPRVGPRDSRQLAAPRR